MLNPINENYPFAICSVVNKPVICYQLEYLERYGITNIMITSERKYAHKIEKFLKNFYKAANPSLLNIQLVVFHEEEESMVVLRHLQQLIYTDFVVMEGRTLTDVPLD